METLLLIIHIFVSIVLVLVVLLQSGKGGGMGATFGGASQQIFGGRGAGSFLTRVTTGAAVVFFVTSLSLSMLGSQDQSVLDSELESKAKGANEDTGENADGVMGAQAKPADGEAAEADVAEAGTAKPDAEASDSPSDTAEPIDAGPAADAPAAFDAPTDTAPGSDNP